MGAGQEQITIEDSKNSFPSWVYIYTYVLQKISVGARQQQMIRRMTFRHGYIYTHIYYKKFQWGLKPPLGLNQLRP